MEIESIMKDLLKLVSERLALSQLDDDEVRILSNLKAALIEAIAKIKK